MSERITNSSLATSVRISTIGASIGLVGGVFLQSAQDTLVSLIPLLIALPALNALTSDLSFIIAAHITDPESTTATRKKLYQMLFVVVPFSALCVLLVSLFIAFLQEYQITQAFVIRYSVFIFGLFIITSAAVTVLSIVLGQQFSLKKKQIDGLVIPLASIVASVLTLFIIALGLLYYL